MRSAALENSPIVFSDVDETLIRGKSLLGFAEHLVASLPFVEGARLRSALAGLSSRLHAQEARGPLNRDYYTEVLGGRSVADVRRVVASWFEQSVARGDFFKQNVCDVLVTARAAGARIVLLSGSFSELLEPIAEHVGASEMLAAPLERVSGRFTGRLLREPTIGRGKLDALHAYASAAGVALEECAGVGDDVSDLPFLTAVGMRFVPIDGHPELIDHARTHGWCVVPDDGIPNVQPLTPASPGFPPSGRNVPS